MHDTGVTVEFVTSEGGTFVLVLGHGVHLSFLPTTAGTAVHCARNEKRCVIITARAEDDATSANGLFAAVARTGAAHSWIALSTEPLPAPPQCTVAEVVQATLSKRPRNNLKSKSPTRQKGRKYNLTSVGLYVHTFCKDESVQSSGEDSAAVFDVSDVFEGALVHQRVRVPITFLVRDDAQCHRQKATTRKAGRRAATRAG